MQKIIYHSLIFTSFILSFNVKQGYRCHANDFPCPNISTLDYLSSLAEKISSGHTASFGSEMVEALQVSRKNIFCSLNVDKIKEKRIFEIVHCPFELSPNQHRPAGPFGWLYWCSSAQPSKGQCTISKILSSPILSLFIEQNIFFPETYNAYTISEPKFTVCPVMNQRLNSICFYIFN